MILKGLELVVGLAMGVMLLENFSNSDIMVFGVIFIIIDSVADSIKKEEKNEQVK